MNDYTEMGLIYEAFISDSSRANSGGTPITYDRKHSFNGGGINNPQFVDNSYAMGVASNNSAIEDEEGGSSTRAAFQDFCEELRGRGQERIANELALLIQKFF